MDVSTGSRFLDLPPELRDQIYEFVALDTGIYLHPRTGGDPISPTPLLRICRQVHDDYNPILWISDAVITARVDDFDFDHVVSFMKNLADHTNPPANAGATQVRPPTSSKDLKIIFHLTPACRKNTERLQQWLRDIEKQTDDDDGLAFHTTYTVHESDDPGTTIAPITLMRVIDEVYGQWYVTSPPGRYKSETRKVADCLGEVEMRVNRMRAHRRLS